MSSLLFTELPASTSLCLCINYANGKLTMRLRHGEEPDAAAPRLHQTFDKKVVTLNKLAIHNLCPNFHKVKIFPSIFFWSKIDLDHIQHFEAEDFSFFMLVTLSAGQQAHKAKKATRILSKG
jgi:hypothetical protein